MTDTTPLVAIDVTTTIVSRDSNPTSDDTDTNADVTTTAEPMSWPKTLGVAGGIILGSVGLELLLRRAYQSLGHDNDARPTAVVTAPDDMDVGGPPAPDDLAEPAHETNWFPCDECGEWAPGLDLEAVSTDDVATDRTPPSTDAGCYLALCSTCRTDREVTE